MGWLRKKGKQIARSIKKVGKKIGKAFKSAFKSIGKFVHKLGPIGTIGMMIAMPYLGSYVWSSFGTWAGGLQGTMGNVMQTIYKAGNSVMGAYRSVTDAVYGTLKKIPVVGDALEGMDRFLDRARQSLGLEPGSVPVMNDKELSTWMNSEDGLQLMGFDSIEGFKAANPSFFNSDGSFTSQGLNFGRGHSVAFEAHLRGKDIYKTTADGEFNFKEYSNNFNEVLKNDFDGTISNFGKSFQDLSSVNLRTGTPASTQAYESSYQEALDKATKGFTAEEYNAFDIEKFRSDFNAGYTTPKSFESPTGLFGEKTGTKSFEGIPSRYNEIVYDAEAQKYITVEGTKFGRAAQAPLLGATATGVERALLGSDYIPEGTEMVYNQPVVPDIVAAEPARSAVDFSMSQPRFAQTNSMLNMNGITQVPLFVTDSNNLQSLTSGGIYMPQFNLPDLNSYQRMV
jgi:hypothetical protein|tara:strand:+ start:2143 stop:3504 length:1362 start_codon:yes stop_codon:yes gene_type:complete